MRTDANQGIDIRNVNRNLRIQGVASFPPERLHASLRKNDD